MSKPIDVNLSTESVKLILYHISSNEMLLTMRLVSKIFFNTIEDSPYLKVSTLIVFFDRLKKKSLEIRGYNIISQLALLEVAFGFYYDALKTVELLELLPEELENDSPESSEEWESQDELRERVLKYTIQSLCDREKYEEAIKFIIFLIDQHEENIDDMVVQLAIILIGKQRFQNVEALITELPLSQQIKRGGIYSAA